jgi:hypothetical protein
MGGGVTDTFAHVVYYNFPYWALLDEMENRIDDLEKNIADLMTQAGVEGADK